LLAGESWNPLQKLFKLLGAHGWIFPVENPNNT